MTALEAIDRRLHQLFAAHADRTDALQDRRARIDGAYQRATHVDEAVQLDRERDAIERELAAVCVVHTNTKNAMQAARHAAARRDERIAWLRRAIEAGEAIVEAGQQSEGTRQAEIDLRTWRPALEALEAEEREALRQLGVEPESATVAA